MFRWEVKFKTRAERKSKKRNIIIVFLEQQSRAHRTRVIITLHCPANKNPCKPLESKRRVTPQKTAPGRSAAEQREKKEEKRYSLDVPVFLVALEKTRTS